MNTVFSYPSSWKESRMLLELTFVLSRTKSDFSMKNNALGVSLYAYYKSWFIITVFSNHIQKSIGKALITTVLIL